MAPRSRSDAAALRSHRVTPGQRKQKRRQTQRGAETRAGVVQAAVDCICEEGFAASSTSHIAERAGVTWGVMQYHFGDRGGLLSAVLDAGYEHLTERLREIEITGDSLEERVRVLVDEGWRIFGAPMARACFEIILATRSEMTPRSASRERLMEVARQLSDMSDDLLARAVRGRRPPKRTHLVLTAALRGFTFELMQVPSDHDYQRERDALVEILSAYLARFDRA
ncbi:MAG: TetR/AcrR family transcriptional regulator [Deltaproteobacteria bacterium]|nr:TetR/AcrR family transcriptional regulator [Deltaproteobacteria bacterium]